MTKIFNKETQTNVRKILRNSGTKSEAVLWKHLSGNQLGYKFRRQAGIGQYIADFYCPKLKLVIEIDGSTHEDELVQENDLQKQNYFKKLGLHIKRYRTEQIFKYLHETLEDIYNTCEYLVKQI